MLFLLDGKAVRGYFQRDTWKANGEAHLLEAGNVISKRDLLDSDKYSWLKGYPHAFILVASNEVLIPWTTSDVINKGQATNELKVIAQESRITLYVNNKEMAKITDKSFTDGVAGPVAAEQGHVAVSFVKVWELP